jgi:hypothetical protein
MTDGLKKSFGQIWQTFLEYNQAKELPKSEILRITNSLQAINYIKNSLEGIISPRF